MLTWILTAMGTMRVIIGLAPLVAPAQTSALLGFPPEHDNATARMMGGLFGVRDIGLGVLIAIGLTWRGSLPAIVALQLATDLGDAMVFAVAIRAGRGGELGAKRSMAVALSAAACWALVLLAMS